MTKIHLDFETRSFADLKSVGAWKYSEHPTTDIICMAYRINGLDVRLWVPGDDLPRLFNEADLYIARNALFEHAIICNVAILKYGFPERMRDPKNWECTAAMSRRVGMPGGLEACAQALAVPQKKLTTGVDLIRRYSCPVRQKGKEPYFRELTGADQKAMYEYCMADVVADSQCYAILSKLPENNSPAERAMFVLDLEQNSKGLPIDSTNLFSVTKILHTAQERAEKEAETTGINVKSPKQIIELCKAHGYKLPNAQKATIDDLLNKKDLPPVLQTALGLRTFLSKASVKKFDALCDRVSEDGRLRHTIQYFGAHTGRFSGRGFQPHNLPKMGTKPEELDDLIKSFSDSLSYDDMVQTAKKILPAMIQAEKGQNFIMGDFSAIEARALAFLAGQKDLVTIFRNNGDVYIDMASRLYRKKASEITKAERQLGKVVILACGYGMGANRFTEACKNFGIEISASRAEQIVNTYRDSYPEIPSFWYDIETAFTTAFRTHTKKTFNKWLSFEGARRYVKINLPSGRAIYYHEVQYSKGQLSYYNHQQKRRVYVYGGILVENIVQAICRDLLTETMVSMASAGLHPIMHVHDEIICAEKKVGIKKSQALFDKIANTPPAWFTGFPLKTESEISGRYHK